MLNILAKQELLLIICYYTWHTMILLQNFIFNNIALVCYLWCWIVLRAARLKVVAAHFNVV